MLSQNQVLMSCMHPLPSSSSYDPQGQIHLLLPSAAWLWSVFSQCDRVSLEPLGNLFGQNSPHCLLWLPSWYVFWATMSSSQARPSHHWGVSLPQMRPSDPETRKWAYQTDHKKPVFHLWFYGAEVALSNLLLSPCLTLQYHQLWMSTAPSNKGRAYDSHTHPANGFVLPPALEKN